MLHPQPLRNRETTHLDSTFDRSLSLYALAAGAAGVSLLALAQPAEGKIIYTPTSQRIGHHTFLDLNGDGINDFQFSDIVSTVCYGSHCGVRQTMVIINHARLDIYGVNPSNQALGEAFVSQLAKGVTVGSAGPFQGAKFMGGIYTVDGTHTQANTVRGGREAGYTTAMSG